MSDKIFATCSTKAGICGSTGCVTAIGGAQHGVVCTDASFIASINCPVHGEAAKCSTLTTGSTPSLSATCTGASYTGALISAASSTTCVRSTCDTTDTNCCELIAKCDSITTSFAEINDICSAPDYTGALIADAATTDCRGGSCTSSDSAACCVSSFVKCDTITTGSDPNLSAVCTGASYSGSLISTASSTNCATDACGTTDASKCCAALCSTITSSSTPSLAEICTGGSFLYTGNLIAGTSCTGSTCSTLDKATCCEVNARCNTITTGSTPTLAEMCSGASYTGALIAAASTTNCDGLTCTSADDADPCCEVKAFCDTITLSSTPTLAETCTSASGSTGALIGASGITYCAGSTCATSDTDCCVPYALCSTIDGIDGRPALDSVCDSNHGRTGELIANAKCGGAACSSDDTVACCESTFAKCNSLTASSTPTAAATCTGALNKYTGSLIEAATSTYCAGTACATSDASSCCQVKASCDTITLSSTPTLAETCTSASGSTGALIGTNSDITYCARSTCATSDNDICCVKNALCDTITTGSTPTLAETCTSASGSTGALIGASGWTYCAGTTCATSDTNCCVQSSGDQGSGDQGGGSQPPGQPPGGQPPGGGLRRLNSKTGTESHKRRRSLLMDPPPPSDGSNNDVDCIGDYHSCDSDCIKRYEIKTAATGEGAVCTVDDNEMNTGDTATCTLDENTSDKCTGISCVGSISICSQNCYKKYSVSIEKSGDGTECQFGGKKIENNEKVLCTYSESTSDACVDPNDPDGVIAPVISQTVVPGKETTILNNC